MCCVRCCCFCQAPVGASQLPVPRVPPHPPTVHPQSTNTCVCTNVCVYGLPGGRRSMTGGAMTARDRSTQRPPRALLSSITVRRLRRLLSWVLGLGAYTRAGRRRRFVGFRMYVSVVVQRTRRILWYHALVLLLWIPCQAPVSSRLLISSPSRSLGFHDSDLHPSSSNILHLGHLCQ